MKRKAGCGRRSQSSVTLTAARMRTLPKDEDSAEALLKKHRALMLDIESYRGVINGLHGEAQKCRVSEDPSESSQT